MGRLLAILLSRKADLTEERIARPIVIAAARQAREVNNLIATIRRSVALAEMRQVQSNRRKSRHRYLS